jgi:hypothetical protein
MMIQRALLLTMVLAAAVALVGQEGHPLRGTWHGNYGPDAKTRTDVTLVLDWDGKAVTGIMNPGLRSAPLQKTSFDPATWMFHFEADAKDRAGTVSHVVIDAKIDDVTNARRTLAGTWMQGSQKGDFKAQRDN